jgi:hypothetical protein
MKRVVLAAALSLVAVLLVGVLTFAYARGGSSPTPGRQTVTAPIDDVQVVIRESNPPQATVIVMAGLPSGCAQRDSYSVSRAGDTFTVSVLNSMPTGNPICTMIYGTYQLSIDLGRDLQIGGTYTVHVNDKTTTFKT